VLALTYESQKYLQDSDSDEDAVSSRKGSADEPTDTVNKQHHEVERVDKSNKNGGSGVSWRAFSAGRAEQRNAELEALQANLRRRGRSIQFCPTATTDDGRRLPLWPTADRPGSVSKRPGPRAKSPPGRSASTQPFSEEDEMADRQHGGPVRAHEQPVWNTNLFSGE
jgi:hypothetical protein